MKLGIRMPTVPNVFGTTEETMQRVVENDYKVPRPLTKQFSTLPPPSCTVTTKEEGGKRSESERERERERPSSHDSTRSTVTSIRRPSLLSCCCCCQSCLPPLLLLSLGTWNKQTISTRLSLSLSFFLPFSHVCSVKSLSVLAPFRSHLVGRSLEEEEKREPGWYYAFPR